MKLVYFEDPHGNFGDDLNPWLWEKLLPGVIDEDPSDGLLIGMGTVLEPWFFADLPTAPHKYVLGSGSGMSVPPLEPDGTVEFAAVRGPLTAAYLGLPASCAATDPATCLGRYWNRPEHKRGGAGFMPHHKSLLRWDWKTVCTEAGLEYIDPAAEPLATLDQIANLDLVITEAMHGAIVADALRVPWFPVQISPINYVGKWHDWSASVRMPIHFQPLPDLYDPLRQNSVRELGTKGWRMAAYELRRKSSRRDVAKASEQLRGYAANYEPYLSTDANLDRAVSDFEQRLHDFRRKHQLRS
jgi:succinoglycan biosynthesis protein ExoV